MLRVKNQGYFTLYPISFLTRAGLDCTDVVTSLKSKRKEGIILGKAEPESEARGKKIWLNAITLVESGHDGGKNYKHGGGFSGLLALKMTALHEGTVNLTMCGQEKLQTWPTFLYIVKDTVATSCLFPGDDFFFFFGVRNLLQKSRFFSRMVLLFPLT